MNRGKIEGLILKYGLACRRQEDSYDAHTSLTAALRVFDDERAQLIKALNSIANHSSDRVAREVACEVLAEVPS